MSRILTLKSLIAVCVASSALMVGSASASASFGYLGGMNNFGGGADGSLVQLDQPHAVARSIDGSFFITDVNNSRVVKLDSNGQLLLTWGFQGSGDGQFNGAWDIDIAPDGTVFVTDISNHRIQWFSQDGTFIGKLGGPGFGTGVGQFNQPTGVAVAPDGSVWVSDSQNDRLQHFTLTGGVANTPTIHGTTGSLDGQFLRPNGIDVDPTDSSIFVVDYLNKRVQHLDSAGVFINKFGTNNAAPTGMGAPRDVVVNTGVTPREVLVSNDYSEHRIQRWTTTGTLVGFWGDVGAWPNCVSGFSHMCQPSGLFVDGSTLWVADKGNSRIVSYVGIDDQTVPFVEPVATTAYGTNGSGVGQLNRPQGIATAPDGSAYVTDVENHRVQHWSAAGEFISAFGSAGTGDGQFQRLSGVAVAPDGDVYVLEASNEAYDFETSRIQRFDADGNYEDQFNGFGTTAGLLSDAYDLAIDGSSNVFVADTGKNRVVKFDASGGYLDHWGQPGAGDDNADVDTARGIAVNAAGTKVYLVDGFTNRVKSFESDGTFIAQSSSYLSPSSLPERFDSPTGIDVDPVTGDVLVADSDNRRIKRLSSSLAFVSNFGALGSAEGSFLYPEGVAVDANGYAWITDSVADRLQRFGDAPEVQITSPTDGSSLIGGTGTLQFIVTDAGSDCDAVNGSSIGPLAVGSHTISVGCSNAQGNGTASVTVNVPAPITPPAPGPGGSTAPPPSTVTLKLSKKLKLTKSRKLKFSVTCPDGCTVTPKIAFGKVGSRIKQVRLAANTSAQPVTIKLSASQYKKSLAALKRKKPVTLTVTVLSYKATQGKSGKASLAK